MSKKVLGVHLEEEEFYKFKEAVIKNRETITDVIKKFIKEYIEKANVK